MKPYYILREDFLLWVISKMPRWFIYRCAIRLGVHAATGDYSGQIVPELTFVDALKRWE